MKILVVDDEELAVDNLLGILESIEPECIVAGFTEADDAFRYLLENQVDIALLDIEMGEFNGITLAKKCKELCPNLNIIFVTGYSDYTMDALKLHASGYIMKPVRKSDLRMELDNLRHPLPVKPSSKVRIQTFGNFEIFVEEKPLPFPRTKCLECLAYLVDRKGARVTTRELAAILWEERPYDRALQNNVHRIISDMMKSLKRAGIDNIIIKEHRELAIDPQKVDCDYFKLLSGDASQLNIFQGEYMSNYSWATFTLAGLINDQVMKK